MKRKRLALAMTFVMLVSLFSLSTLGAFADETESDTPAVAEEEGAAAEAEPAPGGESGDGIVEEEGEQQEAITVTEEADGAQSAAPAEESSEDAAAAVAADEEEPAAGNPPSTVSTVDSRADGITLNLFDYDLTDDPNAGDTWNNWPTSPATGSWPTAGINQDHNLKFFGHGGEPIMNGNCNLYTGEPTARQGIVKQTLGEDGYPVMTDHGGQSLSYLFDTSGGDYKTVYSDVNHLFQLDGQGNYVFDSDNNYAYYDPAQGSGGDFKVYDGTYEVDESVWDGSISGNKMPVGYFPFDDWNENKTDVEPAIEAAARGNEPYNHQHGLTMECDLFIPESGKVDGDDIVFHFSGDDDAWLFIDDVLVMDIGGLHLPLGGDLNLTTGEVTTDSAVPATLWAEGDATVTGTIGTSNTLDAIFAAAGKEWNPAGHHTMKFFYLERGGCYSNLAIATNVWKATGIRFNVEKVWNDEEDHSGDEVMVDLYADGEKVDGKTLTLNDDNGWKDTFNGLPVYNEDGEQIVYTVKEQNVDDYIATYEKGGEVVKEKTYWVPVDAADLEDGETYAITAPDWMAGNATRIFEGTEGLIETNAATDKEQTVPGENQQLVDEEGSYEKVLKNEPTADQLFVATRLESDGQQEGTFWKLSNGSGNLTLVGNYHWWDNSYAYWYTMTATESWDGTNNYQNALKIDPEDGGTAVISAAQYWGNQWGGLDRGQEQFIFLTDQNGTYPSATHPDPIWNRDWCAHVTFWKQVTVEETTPLPDDWTITNTPAGDLTVEKKVVGTDEQKKQAFTFVVKLGDESISGEYGDMTFTSGYAMFTLKDGESITAEDLPTGISYEVIEAAGSNYKAEFTGEKGEIKPKTDAVASFTNTFDKQKEETKPVPPVEPSPKSDGTPGTGDGTLVLLVVMLLLASGGLVALTGRKHSHQ